MKIHDKLIQGSPDWLAFRAGKITGTDVANFCLEPISLNLTVAQIHEILTNCAIPFKKSAPKGELVAHLPDPGQYMELSTAARNLLLQKIGDAKQQDPWQLAQAAKEERQFSYMIPIDRGNKLEPAARAFYERKTGMAITEVGFVSDDSEGYGMSPDGLVLDQNGNIRKGIELKCPMPDSHRRWLLDHYGKGTVPADHFWQCQMGMVSCECDEWDFLSFCPTEAPLLVTLYRSETTDQLEAGLEEMLAQKRTLQDRLADMWDAEFGGAAGIGLLTFHNGNPMFDIDGNPLDQDGNLIGAEGQGS
jgi:hypothetical protein